MSNLSSSRALRDITEKWGGTYYASAVGEVNVTTLMHSKNALFGGEGNGGVIFPQAHCGRDAMVGVALFLSYLAARAQKMSEIKASLPQYTIVKNRIDLSDSSVIDWILQDVKKAYSSKGRITDIDGVKIDFDEERKWVHLRKSNTEPIIRIYAEAPTQEAAEELSNELLGFVHRIISG